jgi:hypothetical protein
MLESCLKKSALLVCIAGFVLSSCKKDVTPDPLPLSASTETLMASSTSSASLLSGSNLQLGINGHPLGDAPYLATSPAKQVNLLKSMNMSWYRIDVLSQSNGTVTVPHLLTPLLEAAAAGNIKLLPMLNPRTMNLSDTEAESYSKGKTLGANFAAKYAQYFSYYDLGNDLDLKVILSNKTGQSQDHYDRKKFNTVAAYLKGMDEGIKSKDPDAKTMISAGWLHYGFIRMCDWYGVKFDVVAYHWYSDMEAAAPKSPNNIPDITKKLSSLFPNKPIWFTEFNYRYKSSSTTNEADQKTFVSNFIKKCKSNPQVKVVMIYELFDEPYKSADEKTYGIAKWVTSYTLWKNKLVADYLSGK